MLKKNLQFCPGCGSRRFSFDGTKEYRCTDCGFNFFFNPAAAVSAVVIRNDKLLVTVRAREPGAGMLDFPGGFVDPGESITTALEREMREELSASLLSCEYFCSSPNYYCFADVEYTICDIYFRCELQSYTELTAADDVAEYRWILLDRLDAEEFESLSARNTVKTILERFYAAK